ncbi:hypothetical protein N9L02_03560, partial [Gammaproteobacteria bacterium]|nr:hypothetical protein [Gammaproteobacteria bacterium]
LKKANDFIGPIQLNNEFVFIKLFEFKEPRIQTFMQIKPKVLELYAYQKSIELFAENREKLANLSYQYPESLNLASKELNLPIKETSVFTRNKGASDDISANKKVRDISFSKDVLILKNNSDVIQQSSESAVVVRLKSHLPSSLLPLKSVKEQIIGQLTSVEVDNKIKHEAINIVDKLNSGAASIDIIDKRKFSWINSGFVGRYSENIDPSVLAKAFEAPIPSAFNKKPYFMVKTSSGYAVVKLKAVRGGKLSSDQSLSSFTDQYQNSEGVLEYNLYQLTARDKAKIITK